VGGRGSPPAPHQTTPVMLPKNRSSDLSGLISTTSASF
jgi:hypothetical protein